MEATEWIYQQPPPPTLNGGWYTGAPFMEGAPWRTHNVTPDVAFMINNNLRSAQPPPGATSQYPGSYRPGNNAQSMPGVIPYKKTNDIMCVSRDPQQNLLMIPHHKFSKYAYLS